MPKNTFYNLNEEKKKRIFDAAVQEFAAHRFSEASLNKIVKAAEIPWGSFYQYFSDKEDIYLYMYEVMGKEKRDIVHHANTVNSDADFFEICIQAIRATFEWAKVKPEYIQIAILMEIDNSEFIAKLRNDSAKKMIEMVERDKKRGLIKPEANSELIVDIIYTLIWRQFPMAEQDENIYFKKLKDGIKIIKEGVSIV
jgi:AcrR family transcriptional regulator